MNSPPKPEPPTHAAARQTERRRQLRGLLLLAIAVLLLSFLREHIRTALPRGWWHLW